MGSHLQITTTLNIARSPDTFRASRMGFYRHKMVLQGPRKLLQGLDHQKQRFFAQPRIQGPQHQNWRFMALDLPSWFFNPLSISHDYLTTYYISHYCLISFNPNMHHYFHWLHITIVIANKSLYYPIFYFYE